VPAEGGRRSTLQDALVRREPDLVPAIVTADRARGIAHVDRKEAGALVPRVAARLDGIQEVLVLEALLAEPERGLVHGPSHLGSMAGRDAEGGDAGAVSENGKGCSSHDRSPTMTSARGVHRILQSGCGCW